MNTLLGTRTESDLLGNLEVPDISYYGIQTLRALNNFNLTSSKLNNFPVFIKALAMVKLACAKSNRSLNQLDAKKYSAIEYACNQLIKGNYLTEFPIDMLQGGAGTSTNMNINEVIANIGLEFLGHRKGEYKYLHPNNDVNMSQSTNDVYPTAIKIGLLFVLDDLNFNYSDLIQQLKTKSDEFSKILKMGRTQLQDAVPMTLGQEFGAFANTLNSDLLLINKLLPKSLSAVNLGGTAIGTGINTNVAYRLKSIEALSFITCKSIKSSPDLIEATSDMGDFVLLSGLLKRTATKLSKISNDLRLLSSGPRAGLNEIFLEPRQPGSSIMPGKVNPVIPEAMNLACFQVIANDLAITLAAEAGQLQLNAMEPLIALKLFESIDLLGKAMAMFENKCIKNIRANTTHCEHLVANSIGIITALNPYLGYETTTRIAKQANVSGVSILNIIKSENLIPEVELQNLLSIQNMVFPKDITI